MAETHFSKRIILRHFRRLAGDLGDYLRLNFSGNKIQRLTDFRSCQRPVLLIYGFGGTRRIFNVLEKRLRKDGYCVFSIHLGGLLNTFNTGGIVKSAQLIKRKVDKLRQLYELGPLSIIGYSKGGLIGAYYTKFLGGDENTASLITLGTPHKGTLWAFLGLISPLAVISRSMREMWPGSPFLRNLRKKKMSEHVHYVSIYSRGDAICPYPSCCLDEGEAPNVRNIELFDLTHTQFVLTRRAYESIKRELETGAENFHSHRRTPSVQSIAQNQSGEVNSLQSAQQIAG